MQVAGWGVSRSQVRGQEESVPSLPLSAVWLGAGQSRQAQRKAGHAHKQNRDSTGRVRLSLAGGDSIWVQMDAILSVLPPEEAAAAKEAAKAAQKAKVEAEAYNLATAGRQTRG